MDLNQYTHYEFECGVEVDEKKFYEPNDPMLDFETTNSTRK